MDTAAMGERVTQQIQSAADYARANPYTIASLVGTSTALVTGAMAYYRFRARPHPHTISMDLPMHPFLGHVPSVIESIQNKQWLYKEIELTTTKEAMEAGLITLCLPNILFAHIHYITDPELIKFLWNDLNLPKDHAVNECLEELFGNSIFPSNGAAWQTHRNIISAMFSQHNLQGFMFDCSRETSMRVVDMLKSRMIEDESGKISTTVDMFDVLGRFTMDVIVEICFGKKCGSIESFPKEFAFGTAFDRAFDHSSNRVRDPFWKIKRALQIGDEPKMTEYVKIMYDYIEDMLDMQGRKKMIIDETGITKHDIVSLYLSKQTEITDDEELTESDLRFVALSFIAAGRDTTRNLLAWCLALMCTSEKEWMERVMAEIRGIDSKDPSYEDINKRLRLTECVLLETLRLYPSVVGYFRRVTHDMTLPNGVKLLKDDRVAFGQHTQARNTKVYGKDAAEFKPMRWWDKGINTFPSHVFGAFHIEPRMCLGRKFALNQAKTFLFYFLRAFDHRSVGDVFPRFPTSGLLIMEDGWEVNITAK